ncbi:efflux RND transporter periplasmic adaptor subunit [Staphylococcus edaphicus]|uniref:HlyD family secretion protein n=1 Tax=Staphylococcus edaphicus TaxID=1955013 RepID=A0A2C6WQM5_9STAP|nr:efflux RND transporter periplasmic adaptor subunit [Staphylococcus edaphicus]PHK50046.1 HlyD family secretion protein [Staphylococcus edaphicus]
MKKRQILIFILVILFLISVVTLSIYEYMHVKSEKQDKGYQSYKVERITPLKLTGRVYPDDIKTYKENKNIGKYIKPQVKKKENVKKGTPLIYYDTNHSIRPNLVEKVKKNQRKVDEDYKNINKQPNNEGYQKKLRKDLRHLNKANQQLSEHDIQSSKDIYAKFDGKVNFINTDVDNNGDILKLISKKSEIKTEITEYDKDKINIGGKVRIAVNKGGEDIKGEILDIDDLPTNSEKSKNISRYKVTIGNLNHKLENGFTVKTRIYSNTLKIPKDAITQDHKVFVLDKINNVHKRRILTGHSKDQIIVKKGLKPGERILRKPNSSLKNGNNVKIDN